MAQQPYQPTNYTTDPRQSAGNLLKGILPGLHGSVDYFNEMLGGMQDAGRGILRLTTPEGIRSKVSETRTALLSDAQKQSKLLRMKIEGMGGGIGTKQGAEVSAVNAANQTANDLQAHFATPSGQMELFNIISQLAQRFPGLDVMAVLSQIFAQNTQPKSGGGGGLGGLLQGLGGLAAMIPGGQAAAAPLMVGGGYMGGGSM